VTAEAFCTTTADWLAELVTLWMVIAEPVVPPVSPYRTWVEDPVIDVLAIVIVKVEPALIVGVVMVI